MPADSGAAKSLLILGTRGVPGRHGGFETFAERFALYLVAHNWAVTVYCQGEQVFAGGAGEPEIDIWKGIRRVTFNTTKSGARGTMEFDWLCLQHARRENGVPLILGYNTALYALPLCLNRPVLMNMDGIEWKREKWSFPAKAWLYLNEWCGARMATRLIADHPAIADHLNTRRSRERIVTIPYGADRIVAAPEKPVRAMGLVPGRYFMSVGRIEPENSILEMISAFAARPRDTAFVCVGKLVPEENPYHAEVIAAAQGRVIFPGAIYDNLRLQALRFHALAYCHGHTVGGTNPSLVEALGAGNAVVAHDNKFNRWVCGSGQLFFDDTASCEAAFDRAERDGGWVTNARAAAVERFTSEFTWDNILSQYERLCASFLPQPA